MKELTELKQTGEAPEWLTEESLKTLMGGYLLPNETPKGMWQRAARASATALNKPELEEKFFDLMWKNWLCLSTPVAANSGVDRGLNISCFGSYVPDSVVGIFDTVKEIAMLSKHGGGTSAFFGDVRGRGEKIKGNGKSDGVIPFNKIFDSTVLGVSQGGVRRGAFASYLPVTHPDIHEFLEMRRPSGDLNRQCLNIHHGVTITDDWMQKVVNGDKEARELWIKIMKTRFETGEPYLLFIDNANNQAPETYKKNDLKIKASNLCLQEDTLVLTKNMGHQPIKNLVGKTVEIWDGINWVKNNQFRKTGQSELLRVTLKDGSHMDVTPYHKFILETGEKIEAQDLSVGSILKHHSQVVSTRIENQKAAYLKGFLVAEGTKLNDRPVLQIYDKKNVCQQKLQESLEELGEPIEINTNAKTEIKFRFEPKNNRSIMEGLAPFKYELFEWSTKYKERLPKSIFNWSFENKVDFIAGVMDGDGTVVDNTESTCYQIASIHKQWILQFQQLLKTLGLYSSVNLMRKAGTTDFHDGYGAYKTKDCYRLTISNVSARKLAQICDFQRLKKFPQKKGYNTKPNFITVAKIEKLEGTYDVYCTTVPTTNNFALSNGLMTGNCSEIFLHSDEKHTFVCCLSSLNLARWDEWKDTDAAYLSTWFLDGVMQEFINKTEGKEGFERARAFAIKSRALGLGVLGFHTLLQEKMLDFEGLPTYLLNKQIFKKLQKETTRASEDLAKEYGEPEWCVGFGVRNTHRMALAPTVSNSLISGGVSAGIEPIIANAYANKSAKGTFLVQNKTLEKLLESKGQNTALVWSSIVNNEGSVQHLDCLTKEEKEVFKTAREINQFALVKLAADRQQFIDQGQSVNLFFPANVNPKYFSEVHIEAWKQGMKSLYYCRTTSALKADSGSREYKRESTECVMCEG